MSDPNLFTLACPECDGSIQFRAELEGTKIACPHCANEVMLPNPQILVLLEAKCLQCGFFVTFSPDKERKIESCPNCNEKVYLIREEDNPLRGLTPLTEKERRQGRNDLQRQKTDNSARGLLLVCAVCLGTFALFFLLTLLYQQFSGSFQNLFQTGLSLLFVAVVFVIGISIYFVPTICAVKRRHKDTFAIFVINLFLGWTFVGWVISLAWAVKQFPNP